MTSRRAARQLDRGPTEETADAATAEHGNGLTAASPRQPRGRDTVERGERRRHAQLTEPWLTPRRLFALVAVLVLSYAAVTVVVALRTILTMLLVAVFLSFALEPAVQWLSARGMRRGFATGLVFLLALLVGAGLIAGLFPLVYGQVAELVRDVPVNLLRLETAAPDLPIVRDLAEDSAVRDRVNEFVATFEEGLGDQLQSFLLGAASNVVSIGATALGVVAQVATILLVTFYLVADGPRARQTLARPLPPHRQREAVAIWELAVAKTGGYLYSRILLAVISAVATIIFLLALGLAYPVPLGLIVGVSSAFVPVVGTYIGGTVLVLVALLDDPTKALWSLGFLVLYQQVENYLLAPRIQAHTMDVHPAVAFVSVLVGGTLLGAVGALLALPATAIIQALLSASLRRHELIEELGEGVDIEERLKEA